MWSPAARVFWIDPDEQMRFQVGGFQAASCSSLDLIIRNQVMNIDNKTVAKLWVDTPTRILCQVQETTGRQRVAWESPVAINKRRNMALGRVLYLQGLITTQMFLDSLRTVPFGGFKSVNHQVRQTDWRDTNFWVDLILQKSALTNHPAERLRRVC